MTRVRQQFIQLKTFEQICFQNDNTFAIYVLLVRRASKQQLSFTTYSKNHNHKNLLKLYILTNTNMNWFI